MVAVLLRALNGTAATPVTLIYKVGKFHMPVTATEQLINNVIAFQLGIYSDKPLGTSIPVGQLVEDARQSL